MPWNAPYVPGTPAYQVESEENIPENTVALAEGAKVISEDGEHVGDVEKVMTDPGSNLASSVVISKGIIKKDRKIIPVRWIREINEDEIKLAVGSHLVEKLEPFED